jgi:hypothetical protein
MDKLYVRVKQLPMEDLCIRVRQFQLAVGHLPQYDLCIGVRQLRLEDINESYTTPSACMLFIIVKQLSMDR